MEREKERERERGVQVQVYIWGINGRNRRNLPLAARRAFLQVWEKRFFKRRVPAAPPG